MAIHGDGNVFLTPDLVAYAAMFRQKTQLLLPLFSTRNEQKYFAEQIGDTIKVKRPYYTTVSKGRTLTTAQKKSMVDIYTEVKIDQWWKYALTYNSEESTVALKDLGERYFKSGEEELAYMYDIAGGNALSLDTAYADYKASPAGLTITDIINVRAHATEISIPLSVENYGIIHPRDLAGITNELKDLQAPNLVNEAIRRSFMGRHSHWDIYTTNHLAYMDVTKGGTPLVMGAGQNNDSITIDGWANSVTVLKKGQIITFDGVGEVQLRGDRKSTGRLMQFTVVEDASSNASGVANVKISPDLNDGTLTINDGQGNSVTLDGMKNVTNEPANNTPVNIVGANGKQYRQSIFMAKGALHYVNVIVVPPPELSWRGQAVDDETGLAITVAGQADIDDLSSVRRADAFFGVKVLRPEFAIRWISAAIN